MEKRQSTRALRQRIQPTRHLSNIGAHDHDEVIVSIKDRGTGIDPDILAFSLPINKENTSYPTAK
jgi:C4-dicarboxylate-specific signal transduction histidine kinase